MATPPAGGERAPRPRPLATAPLARPAPSPPVPPVPRRPRCAACEGRVTNELHEARVRLTAGTVAANGRGPFIRLSRSRQGPPPPAARAGWCVSWRPWHRQARARQLASPARPQAARLAMGHRGLRAP
eukprot:scaffold6225_cov188-Prasinococcus_capsulatus_cf.AAC.2